MLTSCKLTGSPEAISAYHTAEENYYFAQAAGLESLAGDAGAQPHVTIHGKLAAQLGFRSDEALTPRAFTGLLAGKDRWGVAVTRPLMCHGIGLTFSARKSGCVACLLTLRDPSIIEAHDKAVLDTMAEIERHCAGTQPRAGEHEKTGSMAYVTVRDGFNRDHDPHLHTHVVVFNMTAYKHRIFALDGREIMARDFNKLWGAMYRAKLAARLNELGYSVSYTKKGELRMDAVPLEVERAFSGRSRAIKAQKEAGLRDVDAWRQSRKEKDPAVQKEQVLESWRARAAACPQKTAAETRAETIQDREAWYKAARWSIEAKQERAGERDVAEAALWQVAARRATDHSARASAQAVVTEYLAELGRVEQWKPPTFAEAERRLEEQVRAGFLVKTVDGRYTTWELVRADRECMATLAYSTRLVLSEDAARRSVEGDGRALKSQGLRAPSTRQRKVAAGILSSPFGIVVVQGDAGAGKTTMLRTVRDAARVEGWETVGVAVQGSAARKLQEESKIPSSTLEAYLGQEKAVAVRAPRLVVVDEASMLDSRGLAGLMRSAARAGDKIVLVGDRNQLQSVGAGKPFERRVEAAEADGTLLCLSENYRQRNPELRRVVELARAGKMREAIERLDGLGKLDEIQDAALRRREVAKEYSSDTLILTGTRAGRDALNSLIRARLLERGALAPETSKRYELDHPDEDGVTRTVERELAVGDRVTFLQNEYRDYDVRNGELGTVTRTAAGGVGIRLDDGREVSIDLWRYEAIDHGYALTTYKSQGQTYNRVVVEADTRFAHLQDQRNSYVQITRAREDVKIYTDDREALREAASVYSVKHDTLDLKKSLAEAAAMERRVREEALGVKKQRGLERKGPSLGLSL